MISMSRSDQRRAFRAGRRRSSAGSGRSGRRRVPSTEVIDIHSTERNDTSSTEVIDVESLPELPPCIDLTSQPEVDFVDLTSAGNNTPIVIQSSQSGSGGSGSRRRPIRGQRHDGIAARRRRTAGVEVLTDSDSDLEELPVLPFEIPNMPTRGSTGGPAAEPESSSSGVEGAAAAARDVNTSLLSPEMKSVSCPVCLDNDKQIKRSGRKIMSTICGHIFCDDCIKSAVQSQKKCPSCRKKLTNKQYHPLYL